VGALLEGRSDCLARSYGRAGSVDEKVLGDRGVRVLVWMVHLKIIKWICSVLGVDYVKRHMSNYTTVNASGGTMAIKSSRCSIASRRGRGRCTRLRVLRILTNHRIEMHKAVSKLTNIPCETRFLAGNEHILTKYHEQINDPLKIKSCH
jgi:hypothetical protein